MLQRMLLSSVTAPIPFSTALSFYGIAVTLIELNHSLEACMLCKGSGGTALHVTDTGTR